MTEFFDLDDRISAAYLHGSHAKGTDREESDLDIALLPNPKTQLSATDLASVESELSMLLRKPVDVGILSTQNLIYAMEVLENGRLISMKDQNLADLFFATAMAQYADFREKRKPVEAAYAV